MSDHVKADMPCRTCGQLVEHRINTTNRWAGSKAHIKGDRICSADRRITEEQLVYILEGEPEPTECPDCNEAPCHPECVSGGGL